MADKSQQALYNQSITDFLIVEYQNDIGGRVHHADFGEGPDGKPLLVEYGANWAQGLGIEGGPENPIWTFVRYSLPLICEIGSPG